MSIDRYRHSCPGDSDIPGLGEHPELHPLNTRAIRSQLSFADRDCLKTERRAVFLLFERITQFYDVIGYVGPLVTRYRAEIGTAYGRWFEERAYGKDYSRREVIHTTNNYAWADPDKIYLNTRFACTETAVLLAELEFLKEVPESAALLKQARMATRFALQDYGLTGINWHAKRCRWGTKGIREHLVRTMERADTANYVSGNFHGRFETA